VRLLGDQELNPLLQLMTTNFSVGDQEAANGRATPSPVCAPLALSPCFQSTFDHIQQHSSMYENVTVLDSEIQVLLPLFSNFFLKPNKVVQGFNTTRRYTS
jgi:hypothetical protein